MREIVLDTETTGLRPQEGHRIIEIGCVELMNQIPTGRFYQQYINPEREVSKGAFQVSGLSSTFLSSFPKFSQIAHEFLDFIGDAPLVIHNASFDMGFLNWELTLLQKPEIPWDRVIDTLQMARFQFPGSPNSLDALCKRYRIENSHREKHGALLDSELLAQVYLELKGGRQKGFVFQEKSQNLSQQKTQEKPFYEPRSFGVSEEEKEQHAHLLSQLSNPLWKKRMASCP